MSFFNLEHNIIYFVSSVYMYHKEDLQGYCFRLQPCFSLLNKIHYNNYFSHSCTHLVNEFDNCKWTDDIFDNNQP